MSFQGEVRQEGKKKMAAPNPPMTMEAATLTLPKILSKSIEVSVMINHLVEGILENKRCSEVDLNLPPLLGV